MDESQRQSLLRAIAVSSGSAVGSVSPQQRMDAFHTLEQFKTYDGRVPVSLGLLSAERHTLNVGPVGPVGGTAASAGGVGNMGNAVTTVDVTAATKLYALGVVQTFLRTGYGALGDSDRLALRGSVLSAARQLVTQQPFGSPSQQPSQQPLADAEARILAMKIAALLADIVVRDFPQRWTTFVSEIYVPASRGGLWSEPGHADEVSQASSMLMVARGTTPGYGPMIGVKIALECLRFVMEDCTDSDYNAKISTKRRNDVLIGLNEVSSQFLPLVFALLSEEYGIVCSAKTALREMETYLASSGRTVSQMTPEERPIYESQRNRRDGAGRLVADCLRTVEKFCQAMPLDWVLGGNANSTANGGNANVGSSDYVGALLHLLREDVASVQVRAASCLEQLAMRKLDFDPWLRLMSALPQAVSEANEAAQQRQREAAGAGAGGSGAGAGAAAAGQVEMLVEQLPFHRGLSKMLAAVISAHVSHITTDKDIVKGQGPKFQSLAAHLNLLAEMLSHPSGRICSEQLNLWVTLLRDPNTGKVNILTPFIERILSAFMQHMLRIRWEDVEEGRHPLSPLIEASWTDKDEYDLWLCDLRSRTSQLFKHVGNSEPRLSVLAIQSRIQSLLAIHASGEPRDHLDPATNQLTQKSEAFMQLEAVNQPLENILQGLPQWAVREDRSGMDPKRSAINVEVRSRLLELSNMIVSWNPPDTWLKFRRTNLLEALKHYWQYDPSTLLSGVDALLVYLSTEDDMKGGALSTNGSDRMLSEDVASLRKRCGVALVSVSKKVPHLLVPWLAQLSERSKTLLSSNTLLPPNRMHLYEFLSCVATAVPDPGSRATFVADVLANAIETLNSSVVRDAVNTIEGFMSMMGIAQVTNDPASATDPENVKSITTNFVALFSALNQLLSVGKRCHEAAKKRPNGGIPLLSSAVGSMSAHNFPDEGPVSINDLAVNDPFVPLWPRILPTLLRVIDVTLRFWHPEYQAVLLRNPIQRYAYAISDDEAYLAMKQDSSTGGVFGEGGTAGSIVSGWDRRDMNLAPKWSGWFNELRNTSLQLLGLLSAQRVLYSPEMASMFPEFVSIVVEPSHLRAMEHRHLTQYLKQFIEIMLISCPSTLYRSHLSPILGPVFEHLVYRSQKTWAAVIQNQPSDSLKALTTPGCEVAAALASSGGEQWFDSFYRRGGLFVGDLESVTGEAAVEKVRVELSRTFSDVLQSALALKGEWALVLANQAKEEQALRKNDPSKLSAGPITRLGDSNGGRVNADGTPRGENEAAIEARKSLRIHEMCRFLLLEDERIAYTLVTGIVESLEYPDAYTCRRCTRICHRILETVAWDARYTDLIGNRMFGKALKAVVIEPKWMVGIEWDMINLIRDIYARLVLGQWLLPGGQGPAMQQPKDPSNPLVFEQSKNADDPLHGGGILCIPSDLPRQMLAGLPGIGVETVKKLDADLTEKRSAKDQKDNLRDMLRIAAENMKQSEGDTDNSVFGRAEEGESLLNQTRAGVVPDLPEKLVTNTMLRKAEETNREPDASAQRALGDLFKLG